MLLLITLAHLSSFWVIDVWKTGSGSAPSTRLEFRAGVALENKPSILFVQQFFRIISFLFYFFSLSLDFSEDSFFVFSEPSFSEELSPNDSTSSSFYGNSDKPWNIFMESFSVTFPISLPNSLWERWVLNLFVSL